MSIRNSIMTNILSRRFGRESSDMGNDSNNKMDTVTLARQDRERQGPLEVEVSYGGEIDLHRHLAGCDKNPGHQKFIPVDQFNMDHLPPGYHDNDLVEYIRAVSDITVRVSVKYVSERRPETFPGSDKPYPGYRGSDMMMVGTGGVYEVHKYPNKYCNNKTCECKECLNSPTPKTRFAHIGIRTAAHDDLVGAHTTCHLFFDKGSTPEVCSGVVTLSGMSRMMSDIETDWCSMTHVTHDLDLADRLDKMMTHKEVLYKRARDKYHHLWSEKETRQLSTGYARREQLLTIIVSHPQGCSKQISIGHGVSSKDVNGRNMYTYMTATCPGSAGVSVCVLEEVFGSPWRNHVHCGNCEDNKKLNYGCSKQIGTDHCIERNVTYTAATCPGSSGARVFMVGKR